MIGALLYTYLGGWIITAMGVAITARRLQDEREPAAHPTLLSVVAGVAWPVLVVALAEAAFFAVTTRMMHTEEPALSVVA
jgi:uncharacterized membrane protein YhaH (DUF805 family)